MSDAAPSYETVIAFIRGELGLKPTGVMTVDGKAIGFKGKKPGADLAHRLGVLIKRKQLNLVEVKSVYKEYGRKPIKNIPDQTIIDFIEGRLDDKPTGSLAEDAKTLGYKGKSPGCSFSQRLHDLIERELLDEGKIRGIYKGFGQESIDDIPDATIVDFIRKQLKKKPTGVLITDALQLGYTAENGSNYSRRLRSLIKKRLLTEKEVCDIYDQFGRENIDDIPDETIVQFINGKLDKKPTGIMRQDAKTLGYKIDGSAAALRRRLLTLIEKGLITRALCEEIYPRSDWSPKTVATDETLRHAFEEGMPRDEICVTFGLNNTRGRKRLHKLQPDDTRRVPRAEFTAAVKQAPSLSAAAQTLGLSELAVLRRAARYLQTDVIAYDTTPSVRWLEQDIRDGLPTDSPLAVLYVVKSLSAKFETAGRKPTFGDIEAKLRIPRDKVESHTRMLILQGLLTRDSLAELAPAA